jgi:sugar phosphate isomerase/epimerase
MRLDLGCAEFCLPGGMEEKLRACRRHGLWMELANTGERDLSIFGSWDVEVRTVQAYLLHRYSLVGRVGGRGERKAALEHVRGTVDMAQGVDAGYVLIVPGYGHDFSEDAEKRLGIVLRGLAEYAADRGVAILVEALSPRKTSLLPSLGAVEKFLLSLGEENLLLAGDTLHAFEAGEDVLDYRESIAELHLKDSDSLPPGRGGLDFKRILGEPWRQLCLEYRGDGRELEAVLDFLASLG